MKRLRLVSRNDASLAIALIATAVVVFQTPIESLLAIARDAERQYHLNLLPGLAVLVFSFGFHEYRKRQQVKAGAVAAEIEATLARARAQELERLVAFGRELGQAVDPAALKQVLWRYLPPFARDRPVWVFLRDQQRWNPYLLDTRIAGRSSEALEAAATEALALGDAAAADGSGVVVSGNFCFPLIVGDTTIGVLGVVNNPPLEIVERQTVGAAVAPVAIAIRNSQLLAETREKSLRDDLTGCFSRTHGFDTLEIELRRATRTKSALSVMMFDIDQFKNVNDQYGHLAGDQILSSMGELLVRVLRVTDLKVRYGGDEFLILLPETPVAGAVQATESLLREVAHMRIASGDHTVGVTISVGVTATMNGELDAKTVIARADEALYQAKRAGKNRYAVAGEPRRSADLLRLAQASSESDDDIFAGGQRV